MALTRLGWPVCPKKYSKKRKENEDILDNGDVLVYYPDSSILSQLLDSIGEAVSEIANKILFLKLKLRL